MNTLNMNTMVNFKLLTQKIFEIYFGGVDWSDFEDFKIDYHYLDYLSIQDIINIFEEFLGNGYDSETGDWYDDEVRNCSRKEWYRKVIDERTK